MEFKILSPQDENLVQDISWNNEELKAEISAKMEDYKGLVFTEETIKEAKKDRASLNKLRSAFEDERKRIKKLYMDPYNRFEQQVKEVIALIDEPIRLIDAQIKEVEENKKLQKRKDIEELFESIGFQNFVSLNQIWDEKWLNASVPMTKIEEQMKSEMYRIGNEVATISRLPEFSFEAMEVYKKRLDMNHAIQEGQRLADIQRRKAEQEAAIEEAKQKEEAQKTEEKSEAVSNDTKEPEALEEKTLHTIDFRVTATSDQLNLLKEFLLNNHIAYGPVPKKGE